MIKKKREFAPDLVRAVAVTFVIAVHFFLYTGFYERTLEGTFMALMAYVRMALMTCVPLFLMLTGYFCYKKSWSLKYYRGLLGTILIYVLASLACLAFRAFWLEEDISFRRIFKFILNYTAAPYAWYVEMYIGLFLLIPFFNAGWNSLGDKPKLALIATLLFLSAVPLVVNNLGYILPVWWIDLYPLSYYAIGAWLREHPPKMKGIWSLLAWLAVTAIATGEQLHYFWGGIFEWSMSGARGSLLVAGEAFFLFRAMLSVKGEKLPRSIKWCVSKIAALSFPVYLVSYIGDSLIYTELCRLVPSFPERMAWYIPCILANLILSCIIAQLIDVIVKLILKLIPEFIKPESKTV